MEVLCLARPERFTADRTTDRYDRPVADVTSCLRVVQNRQAQLPTIGLRKKQRAKVASRDAEQIRRQALDQTAKIEPRGHAVRDFQQQAQAVALMSQFALEALPFALVFA